MSSILLISYLITKKPAEVTNLLTRQITPCTPKVNGIKFS